MKKPSYTYRMPRSVLLTAEEQERVENIAAQLSKERGKKQSKSAIMREAILQFVSLYEVSNGKKGKHTPCRQKPNPSREDQRLLKQKKSLTHKT